MECKINSFCKYISVSNIDIVNINFACNDIKIKNITILQ